MKKVLAICLMTVMVLSMSVNVFAAPGGFVNSPSGNPAPTVVDFDPSNDACTAQLVITPYGDRHVLSETLRTMLEKAYSEISSSDDLTELNAELAKIAADKNIAGKDLANPIATILSAAMMLRYSFDLDKEADAVEAAVAQVLKDGIRTVDIMSEGMTKVGCKAMGDAVCERI